MSDDQQTPAVESESAQQVLGTTQGVVKAVLTGSETVDEALATIDERTSEQAAEMKEVVDDVSSLQQTIEEVNGSAGEVEQRSKRATEEVESGHKTAQDALDTMEEVTDIGAAAADDVAQLETQLDRIESSLAGIDDIADKTNMLALNASIEAQHTDSSSSGFEVVATEIKNLAEQSQKQAEEVDQLLDEVREVASETIGRLNRAINALETGATSVEQTMVSLGEVSDAVEQVAADIETVSEATSDQADTSEVVASRCETAANRAEDIEEGVNRIHEVRADQTEMLQEISDAISTVSSDIQYESRPCIQTGIHSLDTETGGLIEGARSVLQYDGEDSIDSTVARLCVAAITDGYAVSLTPTPTLDRDTFSSELARSDSSLSVEDMLDDNRLFVLDAFDSWDRHRNLFDLTRVDLGSANRKTDRRRDAPLLVVGNIAAEVRILGEAEARAAIYENDSGVLDERDTVINVIDETTIDERFAAFYIGAADQVLRVSHDEDEKRVEVIKSPGQYSPSTSGAIGDD